MGGVLRIRHRYRQRDQAIFRDRDNLRRGMSRILEKNGAEMRLRVVNLYNAGPCRFVGSVEYNDRLAGEILHRSKLDVSPELDKTTYEQAVYIQSLVAFTSKVMISCLPALNM